MDKKVLCNMIKYSVFEISEMLIIIFIIQLFFPNEPPIVKTTLIVAFVPLLITQLYEKILYMYRGRIEIIEKIQEIKGEINILKTELNNLIKDILNKVYTVNLVKTNIDKWGLLIRIIKYNIIADLDKKLFGELIRATDFMDKITYNIVMLNNVILLEGAISTHSRIISLNTLNTLLADLEKLEKILDHILEII